MVFAFTALVLVIACGSIGWFLRFLGPQVRLVEVYLAFSIMIIAASLGSMTLSDSPKPFATVMAMVCGAFAMGSFCFSRTGGIGLGFLPSAPFRKWWLSAPFMALNVAIANVVLANAWLYFLSIASIEHQPQGAVLALQDADDLVRIIWLVYVCLMAPLAEEVLFRGFFWAALKPLVSKWMLISITGVCFGLIHFESWTSVPSLCLFGVALGWLRFHFKSIWAPLIAHVLNNLFVSILLMQTML